MLLGDVLSMDKMKNAVRSVANWKAVGTDDLPAALAPEPRSRRRRRNRVKILRQTSIVATVCWKEGNVPQQRNDARHQDAQQPQQKIAYACSLLSMLSTAERKN